MNRMSAKLQTSIVAALVEGVGIRSTCRITGASKGAVIKLIADLGPVCAAYMDQAGVKAHHDASRLVAKAESSAKDGEVKALAAKLQPTIQQHTGNAEQLNASIKGSTSMGNSGTRGRSGSSERKPQPASGNTDNPENPANPTTQPPAPMTPAPVK